MSRHTKLFLLISAAVAVVGLAGFSYFYNQALDEYIFQLSRYYPAVRRQDAPDTTGWQTYRNKRYEFELEHPEDLSFKDYSGDPGLGGEYDLTVRYVSPEQLAVRDMTACEEYPETTECRRASRNTEKLKLPSGVLSVAWVSYGGGAVSVTEIPGPAGERVNVSLKNGAERKDIFRKILATFRFVPKVPTDSVSIKQECPEEWIVNQMPSGGAPSLPREYFIYQGARRELAEFDVSWVKSNCKLVPQNVY